MKELPFEYSTPITLTTCTMEMESPASSYEEFKKSFEKNWSHHIDSRKNYCSDKTCIFLIERVGNPITVEKNNQFFCLYRLSLDKFILEYMYGFRDFVDYVIFTYSDQCEVIVTKDIPKIINSLEGDMTFGVGRHNDTNLQFLIDINPNINDKETDILSVFYFVIENTFPHYSAITS